MVKYKIILWTINIFMYIMHFICHFHRKQVRLHADNRLKMPSSELQNPLDILII